jgi:hypothetical protein
MVSHSVQLVMVTVCRYDATVRGGGMFLRPRRRRHRRAASPTGGTAGQIAYGQAVSA